MSTKKCFLCGEEKFRSEYTKRDTYICQCENCQNYEITSEAISALQNDELRKKHAHLLSGIAYEKSTSDEKAPFFFEEDVIDPWLKHSPPRNIPETKNRILTNFKKQYPNLGDSIVQKDPKPILSVEGEISGNMSKYFFQPAQFYCRNFSEVATYVNSFLEDKFLKMSKNQKNSSVFQLTIKAHEFIETKKSGTKKVFIAMSFSEELKPIYKDCIKPILEKEAYEPIIMWEHQHNSLIDFEIQSKIKESLFLVTDLTTGNQGAYFETGYAMALGKEVIRICKEGEEVHFDQNHYNIIFYNDQVDLKAKLEKRLKETKKQFEK